MNSLTPKEFEIIYDQYSPAVYGMIYSCVKDQKIAEEILQEVFIKYFSRIKDGQVTFSFCKLLVFARQSAWNMTNNNFLLTNFPSSVIHAKIE
ncbi:MAG: hypothetical protein ABJA78_03190 [Ferruginibacter sp.]